MGVFEVQDGCYFGSREVFPVRHKENLAIAVLQPHHRPACVGGFLVHGRMSLVRLALGFLREGRGPGSAPIFVSDDIPRNCVQPGERELAPADVMNPGHPKHL